MSKRKRKNRRRLEPFEKVDIAVARATALDDKRMPGKAVKAFANLGDQPPLVLLSAGVIAAGAVRKDERLARTGLRMLAAHSLAVAAKIIGKGVIDRTRPDDAIEEGHYKLEEGDSRDDDLRSMPSGHSAGVTAVALAAARDYPRVAGPAAAGAGAIMLALLPSRKHFLSDVVVGSSLGVVAGVISRLLIPSQDQLDLSRANARGA
jgi:membrane-associated phospholipid phosphatase